LALAALPDSRLPLKRAAAPALSLAGAG